MPIYDTSLIDDIYTIIGVNRSEPMDLILVFIAGVIAIIVIDQGLRMFLEIILGPFKR